MSNWEYKKIFHKPSIHDWEPDAIILENGSYTTRILHDEIAEKIIGRKLLRGEEIYQDAIDWSDPYHHHIKIHDIWTARTYSEQTLKKMA